MRWVDIGMISVGAFPEGYDKLYFVMIDQNEDWQKVCMSLQSYIDNNHPGEEKLRADLMKEIRNVNRKLRGNAKKVLCEDTGEEFTSAIECSRIKQLTYNQLLMHLRRMPGYRTVKGNTYRYVA